MEVYTEILVHANGSLSSVYRAVREEVRSVDADQQVEGHGEIVSLESKVTRQTRVAASAAGHDSVGILRLAGPRVSQCRPLQRRLLRRSSANQRIRHPHRPGAQQRHVLRLVFTSAGASIGSGVAAGVLLSFYATACGALDRSQRKQPFAPPQRNTAVPRRSHCRLFSSRPPCHLD